jgi:hypothetical protein
MASWLIRHVLCNHGRVSLLERRGDFGLLVDMWRASHTFMMCVCFADGGGEDGMAGMGLMRVARVILGSVLGVLVRVLRR